MGKDRLAEARILAEDLLADIELTRMGAEQILLKILLKGVRLARLIGDETSLRWLELELHGYEFTDETRSTLEQMRRTFKHKDGTQRAYVIPLGSIEGNIRAEEKRLTSLGAPSLSGEYLPSALDRVHAQINGATASIMTYTQIRSAVLAQIHAFAARTFHELTFSERQEELFEAARRDIDGMLAPVSAKALAKVESITERLGRGDEEAISQAMSTCRRLIDSFADAVSPPQTEPTVVDGQPMEVSKSKVLNRIDVCTAAHPK
jgi:hypothetical protein